MDKNKFPVIAGNLFRFGAATAGPIALLVFANTFKIKIIGIRTAIRAKSSFEAFGVDGKSSCLYLLKIIIF
jgi:hypothetical protein